MTVSPLSRPAGRPAVAVERVLFALAATMTIASVVLGLVVSPWFLALALVVGANQWLFAIAGDCPASLVLRRTVCKADRR